MVYSSESTAPNNSSTVVQNPGGTSTICTVHPDIVQTHILTRLDGQTLASAGCASSQLHHLTTQQKLWRDICNHTWPSTTDPLLHHLISSTFPAAHRSFFSDSFPIPTLLIQPDHQHHHQQHRRSRRPDHTQSPISTKLISAVDVFYHKKLILSKVQELETVTDWFMCSPFRIDLLQQKEIVPTTVKHEGGGEDTSQLLSFEENLTLTWILIDPARKRAANFSSLRPVSVQRHWLTGEIQVRFSTILAGGSSSESVQSTVLLTCGGNEGGDLHVRELSFLVEDMDGKNLSGKECLVLLGEAMESVRKNRANRGDEKKRYDKYLQLKRERKEIKERTERRMDMLCITIGIALFISFWAFVIFS